ncbi:hypothetical protein [Tenacibaculum retecalamus]|uniref:hypothetical protein n=1 Tax=Tenacibaculum retecalamus TaxID=3018315 RepID=UPI0023D96803|nr:hypothetical protein [Tenacibaculum retecalamus]WBX70867.1 hypothetical protein PG912_11655 [Tenacibaculum retecalamus]
MEENKPQDKFSKLFKKYDDSNYVRYLYANRRDNVDEDLLIHPFSFIKKKFIENINCSELNSFDSLLHFKKEIDSKFRNAYNCFELEYSILTTGKSTYLNKIINYLFEYIQAIPNNQNKETEHHSSIITYAIMEVLKNISISHIHLHINRTNRKRLSKWYNVNEPIISFESVIMQSDKRFQSLYYKHMNSFINQSHSDWHTFKALFLGKPLEKKLTGKMAKLLYIISLNYLLALM